jgi:ubiquinone/menaquinone biosynthesis C-methylase UbiE
MLIKENLDVIEEMILSNNMDNIKMAITMLRNSKTESKELSKHKRVLQYAAEFLVKNTKYLPNTYPTKDIKTWFVKNYEENFSRLTSTWTVSKYNGHFFRTSKKPLIR